MNEGLLSDGILPPAGSVSNGSGLPGFGPGWNRTEAPVPGQEPPSNPTRSVLAGLVPGLDITHGFLAGLNPDRGSILRFLPLCHYFGSN